MLWGFHVCWPLKWIGVFVHLKYYLFERSERDSIGLFNRTDSLNVGICHILCPILSVHWHSIWEAPFEWNFTQCPCAMAINYSVKRESIIRNLLKEKKFKPINLQPAAN